MVNGKWKNETLLRFTIYDLPFTLLFKIYHLRLSTLRAGDLLAPQAERFLGRAVGKAEQHGVGIRLVLHAAPGWRDEHILFLPFEHLAVDAGTAVPLDRAIHRAVGRAVGLAAETFAQQLHERADGRHRVAAGCGIGVLELQPVAGVRISAAELLE